jgi:membrane fusion protein (multidrug efflux system)
MDFSRLAALVCALAVTAAAIAQAPEVIVSQARVKPFPLSAEALGNALANEAIEVRAEISALVTAIHFTEGQWVEKDTVLLELENAVQLAELAAARSAVVESRSQYQRSEELYRTNVVSTSQLEQLKAQMEAHEAAVRAAESRLRQTVIRAPFSGRLGLRRVSVGAVVDTDSVITTLDDISEIKLDFDVPEVFMARLEPGLTVVARSAAWPELHFRGAVTSIDTRVDPVSRTITVRALMPNEDRRLRPGMFLTVSLLKEDVMALMVPEEAIVPERSKQFVYVVTPDDLAEMREIRTGRRRPGEVEVLQGLADGEWVISEGTQKARDGQAVAIVSRTDHG